MGEGTHVANAITGLFEGRLSEAEARAVYAHVRTCADCERVYERHARAERHLFAVPDGELPTAAFDRIAERVIATPTPKPRVAHRFAWASIGLFAAAMAGVLVVARLDEPDQMSRRGAVEALDPAHALRVLRVRVGEGETIDVADATSSLLVRGDILKLVYSTGPETRFVQVDVIDEAGRSLARLPPQAVDGDVVEARLDGSLNVADWPSGPISIRAVFGPDADSTTPSSQMRDSKDEQERHVRIVKSRVEATR